MQLNPKEQTCFAAPGTDAMGHERTSSAWQPSILPSSRRLRFQHSLQ